MVAELTLQFFVFIWLLKLRKIQFFKHFTNNLTVRLLVNLMFWTVTFRSRAFRNIQYRYLEQMGQEGCSENLLGI